MSIKEYLKHHKCSKCRCTVCYDDTPYERVNEIKFYDVACPICGNRDYITSEDLKKL